MKFLKKISSRKRILVRMASLLLGINMFLVGCGLQKPKKNAVVPNNSEILYIADNTSSTSTTITIEPSEYENLNLTSEHLELLRENINIEQNESSELQEQIKSIRVEYPKLDLYNIDNVLNKYNNITLYKSNQSNVLINNNKVDLERLYSTVLNNNKEYQSIHNINSYKDTNDTFVYNVCKKIASDLNLIIENYDVDDIKLLDDKLQNLKVFDFKEHAYAFFSNEETILGINTSSVDYIQKENPDINVFDVIASHEIVHLVQAGNPSEYENASYSERVGLGYKWDSEPVNSLKWTWFNDAVAEGISNDINNINEPLNYYSEVRALESIELSTLFGDKALENVALNNDLSKLFNYFDCKSETEKREIIEMFFAYTIIYNDTYGEEGRNFVNAYNEKYGSNMSPQTKRELDEKLKGSICLTLSKEFYSGLIKLIENKNATLEDLFKLITIYEMELSRNLWYQSKFEEIEYFLENYVSIQNILFETISSQIGIDLEEFKKLYCAYQKGDIKSVQISWLKDEDNLYFRYICETRLNDKKDPILKVYEDNFEVVEGIKR